MIIVSCPVHDTRHVLCLKRTWWEWSRMNQAHRDQKNRIADSTWNRLHCAKTHLFQNQMEIIAGALFRLVCEAVAVRCSSVSCIWILTTWVWSDRAIFMSCKKCGLSVGVFNGGWLLCLGVGFLCMCLMMEQSQFVDFLFFFFSFRRATRSEPLGSSSCLFCCIF